MTHEEEREKVEDEDDEEVGVGVDEVGVGEEEGTDVEGEKGDTTDGIEKVGMERDNEGMGAENEREDMACARRPWLL